LAKRFLLLAALLIGSCETSSTVQLSPARMAPWTQALRDSQSEEPYLLAYRKGNARLILVAAQHENDPASKTFKLVHSAFEIWPVDSVIVEGAASSAGPNYQPLLALADEPLDGEGQQPGGETIPALQNARRIGAAVWGGEANDREVLRLAQVDGVKHADVLGFYVLRVIPQWLRDGTLAATSDEKLPELVERQLARSLRALGIAHRRLRNSVVGPIGIAAPIARRSAKVSTSRKSVRSLMARGIATVSPGQSPRRAIRTCCASSKRSWVMENPWLLCLAAVTLRFFNPPSTPVWADRAMLAPTWSRHEQNA
jgi:hypothetical protein